MVIVDVTKTPEPRLPIGRRVRRLLPFSPSMAGGARERKRALRPGGGRGGRRNTSASRAIIEIPIASVMRIIRDLPWPEIDLRGRLSSERGRRCAAKEVAHD